MLSALVIISVAAYVLKKSPQSWTSRYFFIFGLLIAAWQIAVFLNKNAPNVGISKNFYGIVVFTSLLGTGFLIASMLNIPKEKWYYVLVVLPVLPFAVYGLFIQPFYMTWTTTYGWTYAFEGNFMMVIGSIAVAHTIAIMIVGAYILKKHPSLKMKIWTILFGWVVINVGGTLLTNIWLNIYPETPPFGGVINLLSFMVIARGIRLPAGEIKAETSSKITNAYLDFLATFYETLQGEELGEKIGKFTLYIEAMGLNKLVTIKKKEIFLVNIKGLSFEDLKACVDTLLRGLKSMEVSPAIVRKSAKVINATYEELKKTDPDSANEWLDEVVFNHGAFLYSHGALDIFYTGKVPVAISKYQPGTSYLLITTSPYQQYKGISELIAWGYELLSITKYDRTKLDIIEGDRCSILPIFTDEKKESIMELQDLNDKILNFYLKSSKAVVFIDCLDTLIISYGGSYVKNFTEHISRDLPKENNILMAVVNSNIVDEHSLDDVKNMFSEVRSI